MSIFGSDENRQTALAGLKSAAPFVKGELARRLNLRRTPEVQFLLDRGLEKGSTVLGLLSQLGEERQQRQPLSADAGDDGGDCGP